MGDHFSTCQQSTRSFVANFEANFGETFGNFVSNFATFWETSFSRRVVPRAHHCSTGLKISPTDTYEEKIFWPFRDVKRELRSFRHAQVRAFGTISAPLPQPHDILLRGFGHIDTSSNLGLRELNLTARQLVRAFMSTTWGVQAFTIITKQGFAAPRNEMFLIMMVQCVPEEIDLARSLSLFAAFQKQAATAARGRAPRAFRSNWIPSTQKIYR